MSQQNKSNEQKPFKNKPITDDAILKVAKEVVVKFIEVGRLSPQNFDETFDTIFKSVQNSVRSQGK
ncbi:MAG: hypothetical protein KAK02_02110 [Desulfobulbaceae bacterium]|nr:hypothetical protein [Desulfobulbaceae bacterium]